MGNNDSTRLKLAAEIAAVIFVLSFFAWAIAAWITHVVICFKAGSWGFLIAGAMFVPIAWVHGTGAWFGAW